MKRLFFLFLFLILVLFSVNAFAQESYLDPSTGRFTWTAPTVGGPVAGYRVKIGTTPGTYTITSANLTALTVPLSAFTLTQGTKYYAIVNAFNAAGEGPASNEINFIPLAKPGTPGAFQAQ
jgi:hypothetical protein